MSQPQIEFHTSVQDPVGFACRLLRKAYRQGAKVVVMGAGNTLATLDRALWTSDERDFVPHLRVGAGAASEPNLALTPIWLVSGELPSPVPAVLVNLGADVAPIVERFARVIEVVANDDDGVRAARARWRGYRELGYSIQHHQA